jgi:Na+-translocating ferredoxin:NAD+ oxidoreductase RnfC subunit
MMKDKWIEIEKCDQDFLRCAPSKVIQRIREAGIVGMGYIKSELKASCLSSSIAMMAFFAPHPCIKTSTQVD